MLAAELIRVRQRPSSAWDIWAGLQWPCVRGNHRRQPEPFRLEWRCPRLQRGRWNLHRLRWPNPRRGGSGRLAMRLAREQGYDDDHSEPGGSQLERPLWQG